MVGRGTRALLLASWEAIGAALYPEGACDAEGRRAFEEEAREANARVVHWLAYVLAPLCVAAVVIFLRRPESDPARAAWRFWTIGIMATLGALGVVAAIVARKGRPAALWRRLGDAWGALQFLGAAAMSANAQRAHPNLNAFVISAFATAFFLRMRPRMFALALAGGAGLVIAGIGHFRADATARQADELSVIAAASLSLFSFFLARSMRLRVLLARRQVELLNGELERRVEAQVGEIVRRAREIEELNVQLNERIQERSRELSMALARLGEAHEPLAPGAVLGGRVEIDAWIGAGGMGVVYRARDRITNKTVAVKVIQAGSTRELEGLHRFLREAEAMASVTHPAIVRSIHVDVSEEGQLFQVMELVEGESLEARLARAGPLPPPVAARLGAVLAEALAAAHDAGVVHRDVKPSNVMLTREAPGLKLLDFGISKLWDARAPSGRTEGILGTPEFLSPEQVNAPASVGAPADVYALGLVLYLAVAGRMPFAAEGARNWLITHLVHAPLDLATRVPDVDPTLARSVMDCLSKDPGSRPTAAELCAALSKVADAAGTRPLEELDLVQPSVSGSRGRVSHTTASRIDDPAFRSAPTLAAEGNTKP